jgi:hypothetical protein
MSFVAAAVATLLAHGSASAEPAQMVYQSEPVTVTATIEAIDKANRVVTLKTPRRGSVAVQAPPEMEGFGTLRVGDEVSARYYEAIAVRLRKPGDPEMPTTPTTIVRRKDRAPGSETMRDRTVRATIQSVDPGAPSLTVKAADGGLQTLTVTDASQLKALKAGDTIDITYYESPLLVSVMRQPKKD